MEIGEQEEVLQLLVRNKDSIEKFVRVAKAMDETGFLDGLEALAKASEQGFVAVNRPEVMGMVGNVMVLLNLIGSLDHATLIGLSQTLPQALNDAMAELKKAPDRKLGLFELLNMMRSPEFSALLRAARTMTKTMVEEAKKSPL